MTKPLPCWGKASKAFTRYEGGRLAEEDERIESEQPSVFTGKDDSRAEPRRKSRRDKRKLPRPGKNVPIISYDDAHSLKYGEYKNLNEFAARVSELKQKQRACFARGHHEWRQYISTWSGKESRHYVCNDCGEMHS